MNKKNLVICGAGIKSLSHHTKEFDVAVKNAEIVIYLVNEPLLEAWLNKYSKKSLCLNVLYFSCSKRSTSYELISKAVISSFDEHNNVCLVFYGHPLLLADSINMVIQKAKSCNIRTQVLPGVSAFDCLLADLKIKLNGGCFQIDASYFIKNQIKLDILNHVILWQAGVIDIDAPPSEENIGNITSLQQELLKYYQRCSVLYIYEASIYPHLRPLIIKTTVDDITEFNISSIATVYLPPAKERARS